MEKTEDKRHFHRFFYRADAILANESQNWRCQIADLSLKGCLLHCATPWQGRFDESYTLTLALSDDLKIIMRGIVVHAIGHDIGFKCEHIDLDSISNLRRLVELNLGDSKLLERELIALSHSAD